MTSISNDLLLDSVKQLLDEAEDLNQLIEDNKFNDSFLYTSAITHKIRQIHGMMLSLEHLHWTHEFDYEDFFNIFRAIKQDINQLMEKWSTAKEHHFHELDALNPSERLHLINPRFINSEPKLSVA